MNQPTKTKRHALRRAVTLTEVLIAMGILAVGLLGVASVFPVGGFYMQSGDLADRGGAIAQAALEDAVIRGHLNPENWLVHDVSNGRGAIISFADGLPNPTNPGRRRLGLREASIESFSYPNDTLSVIKPLRSDLARGALFGEAYIIDPLGFAGAAANSDLTNVNNSSPIRSFPGFPMSTANQWYTSPSWAPWDSAGGRLLWPVRRVSTLSNWGNLQLSREFFSGFDDLALTLPDSGDEPARQNWETWASGSGAAPSVRQSRGDYSWIISVAPGSSTARNGLATNPDAYPVEVSAVVFHKRVLPKERSIGVQEIADTEKLVDARVVSTSPGGGELLLTKRANDPGESPFEDLRAGQYVLVTGPHPLSTPQRPMLVLRWCRVLNIEDSGEPLLRGGQPILNRDLQVLVSLRGADWPWQAAPSLEIGTSSDDRRQPPPSGTLSNDLKVAIVPGAVAVHTKTMRLEAGSEWSIE